MQLPDRIPAFKWISILWVVYMAIWTMLEGSIASTVFAALFTVLILAGQFVNRYLRGRRFSTSRWLVTSAVMGAIAGLSCGFLTLLLMAMKSGLHAHGPEYSTVEIDWILQQIPLWTFVGLLGGLGFGFLLKARAR